MRLQAVERSSLELLEVPARLGHADDRHGKAPMLNHRLKRGKDFLVSKVACRAKKDESVRGSAVGH